MSKTLIERLESDPEFAELARELQIDGSWTAMQLLAKDGSSSGDGDGDGGSGSGGSSNSGSSDACGSNSSP